MKSNQQLDIHKKIILSNLAQDIDAVTTVSDVIVGRFIIVKRRITMMLSMSHYSLNLLILAML